MKHTGPVQAIYCMIIRNEKLNWSDVIQFIASAVPIVWAETEDPPSNVDSQVASACRGKLSTEGKDNRGNNIQNNIKIKILTPLKLPAGHASYAVAVMLGCKTNLNQRCFLADVNLMKNVVINLILMHILDVAVFKDKHERFK